MLSRFPFLSFTFGDNLNSFFIPFPLLPLTLSSQWLSQTVSFSRYVLCSLPIGTSSQGVWERRAKHGYCNRLIATYPRILYRNLYLIRLPRRLSIPRPGSFPNGSFDHLFLSRPKTDHQLANIVVFALSLGSNVYSVAGPEDTYGSSKTTYITPSYYVSSLR